MPRISALPPISGSLGSTDAFPFLKRSVSETERVDFNTLQSAVANAGPVKQLIAGAITGSPSGVTPNFPSVNLSSGEALGAIFGIRGLRRRTLLVTSANAQEIFSIGIGLLVVSDIDNGGTAICFSEANIITILATGGATTFVTGAPAAGEIQITKNVHQVLLQGGAARNNTNCACFCLGS